jgi:hypothetical protein
MIHLILQFKQRLDREKLEPMLVAGMVPLCMSQYERLFSTTRRPGKEGDVLKHWAPGARGFGAGEQYKHIVILRNGYFLRLQVQLPPSLTPPSSLLTPLSSLSSLLSPPSSLLTPPSSSLLASAGGASQRNYPHRCCP